MRTRDLARPAVRTRVRPHQHGEMLAARNSGSLLRAGPHRGVMLPKQHPARVRMRPGVRIQSRPRQHGEMLAARNSGSLLRAVTDRQRNSIAKTRAYCVYRNPRLKPSYNNSSPPARLQTPCHGGACPGRPAIGVRTRVLATPGVRTRVRPGQHGEMRAGHSSGVKLRPGFLHHTPSEHAETPVA